MKAGIVCPRGAVAEWLAALVVLFFALPAQAVTIGPSLPVTDSTFIPFGDVTSQFIDIVQNPFNPEHDPDALGRYQQVYDASAFGGPITINEIWFYEALPSVGTLNPSTFTIEIGTTSRGVNDLLTCPSNPPAGDPNLCNTTPTPFATNEVLLDDNRGGNMQVFLEDVLLSTYFDEDSGVLAFTDGSSFFYDPGLGENLLVEIIFDPTDEQGDLLPGIGLGLVSEKFFVRDGPNDPGDPSVFSTADNQDGSDNTGTGLRTAFVVPEPSTALLLGVGLAALARPGRRARR